MTTEIKSTPKPTIRRLPQYLHLLKALKLKNLEYVTSTIIANELGFDPTQVRKDIEVTGITGKPKAGYAIDELIHAIREHLNWNNLTDAFLAGTGSLGSAILGYERFKQYGIQFVAAFDTDVEKVDKEIAAVPVLHIDKLAELAERMHVHIGVITVPAEAAQKIADEMIKGGIRAIWNFAPIQLMVPENVVVENAQLSQSLAILTRKLREAEFYDNY